MQYTITAFIDLYGGSCSICCSDRSRALGSSVDTDSRRFSRSGALRSTPSGGTASATAMAACGGDARRREKARAVPADHVIGPRVDVVVYRLGWVRRKTE